jgi:hypothetical protein
MKVKQKTGLFLDAFVKIITAKISFLSGFLGILIIFVA